jgi:hypothetical protein
MIFIALLQQYLETCKEMDEQKIELSELKKKLELIENLILKKNT